jgi:uncharacterized metal-binding protein YceD (DUF177 family)
MPELTRPFPRDRIGQGTMVLVEANAAERAALARRMGLPDIMHLACEFDLERALGDVTPATGHLRARVMQTCVVSLEPFEAMIEEAFVLRFVPAGSENDELDLDAVDEVPYLGNVLDLGEAAAEQLALALDPFPRQPGAALPEDAGAEEDLGAFSALAALRRPEQ